MRPRLRPWLAFLAVAGAVVALDQLVKAWVAASFSFALAGAPAGDPAAPTPLIGDLVRIAKSANDGGIFGTFGASAPLLALASVGVIVGIVVVQARRGVHDRLLGLALGLLLGGAIGNLIDRVRLGYVLDFVDAGIGSWRWYTFNVADAAISIAIVLLLVHAFRPAPGPGPRA